MQHRRLAGFNLFQVVESESAQSDDSRQKQKKSHRPERGRGAAHVPEPVPRSAPKDVAKDIRGDDLHHPPPREPSSHDDASHASLPVRPAGWSRTRRPWTSVSTRRWSRVTISTLWVATRTAVPHAA